MSSSSSTVWSAMFSRNSLLFVALGALLAVKGLSALYDVWRLSKRPRKKKQTDSSYHRVLNGEVRCGWQMVLPSRHIFGDGIYRGHRIVPFGWTMAGKEEDDFALNATFLVRSVRLSHDGRIIAVLRRYSLLSPEKVNATLSRIIYDPQEWSHQVTCYLTSRSVASIFRRNGTARLRLVIADAFQRKLARVINLKSPCPESNVHLVYTDHASRRLCVVFGRWMPINRFELSIASYSVPGVTEGAADENVVYHSTTCDAVSVVSGDNDLSLSFPTADRNMTVFLYNAETAAQLHGNVCISFDHRAAWRVENMNFWLQNAKNKYDRYKRGAWSLLEILNAFRNLDPPEGCCGLVKLPFLEYGTSMETCPIGAGIFAITKDGVFRRWNSPPPLKYLATEKLFQRMSSTLNDTKRDEVKKLIGFDVFGGIPELNDDEEEVPVS